MCILVCVANLDFCKGTGRPAERRGVGASEMEFFGFFKAEVKAREQSGSLRRNLRGQAGGRSIMIADHAAVLAVLIPCELTLCAGQILRNLIEEILTPHSKIVRILDKRQNILLGLTVGNRCKTGAKKVFQLLNIQRSGCFEKIGLPEARFQMLQIDRCVHGKIEHIVIEIAALDAVLPGTAKNGMYLPCK